MAAGMCRNEDRPAADADGLEFLSVSQRLGQCWNAIQFGARAKYTETGNRSRQLFVPADVIEMVVRREYGLEAESPPLHLRQYRCRLRAVHDGGALAGRIDEEIAGVVGEQRDGNDLHDSVSLGPSGQHRCGYRARGRELEVAHTGGKTPQFFAHPRVALAQIPET